MFRKIVRIAKNPLVATANAAARIVLVRTSAKKTAANVNADAIHVSAVNRKSKMIRATIVLAKVVVILVIQLPLYIASAVVLGITLAAVSVKDEFERS